MLKGAYVIITDTHILVDKKIYNLENTQLYYPYLQKIGNEFDEPVFKDSEVEYEKQRIFSQIQQNFLQTISK